MTCQVAFLAPFPSRLPTDTPPWSSWTMRRILSVFCSHLLISLKVAARIVTAAQRVLDTLAWALLSSCASLHFTWAAPPTCGSLNWGGPPCLQAFVHTVPCVRIAFPTCVHAQAVFSVCPKVTLSESLPHLMKEHLLPGLPHSPYSLVYCIFIWFFVWPPPHTDCGSLVAGTLLLYPGAWNRA